MNEIFIFFQAAKIDTKSDYIGKYCFIEVYNIFNDLRRI